MSFFTLMIRLSLLPQMWTQHTNEEPWTREERLQTSPCIDRQHQHRHHDFALFLFHGDIFLEYIYISQPKEEYSEVFVDIVSGTQLYFVIIKKKICIPLGLKKASRS